MKQQMKIRLLINVQRNPLVWRLIYTQRAAKTRHTHPRVVKQQPTILQILGKEKQTRY